MDEKIKVLIVDDEPKIRRLLQVALEAKGYSVLMAEDGLHAITACALEQPDVVLLDLGLPGIDGKEVVVRIREISEVPIIILSVRDAEKEKVAALDVGANDYVTKPFSMPELLARVRVATRSHSMKNDDTVDHLGYGLIINRSDRTVTKNGHVIHLTPTEYALLTTLAANPGRVLTHSQLLRAVWGPGYDRHMRYLRVYIAMLRQKIEDNPTSPKFIQTEPRIGYRLNKLWSEELL